MGFTQLVLIFSFHKLAEYDNLQRIELETNITVTDTRVIAAQTELESLQLQISKESRLSRYFMKIFTVLEILKATSDV